MRSHYKTNILFANRTVFNLFRKIHLTCLKFFWYVLDIYVAMKGKLPTPKISNGL